MGGVGLSHSPLSALLHPLALGTTPRGEASQPFSSPHRSTPIVLASRLHSCPQAGVKQTVFVTDEWPDGL